MGKAEIHPKAYTDLDAIAQHIQVDRPQAAREFLDAARKRFELLSEYPQLGVRCGFKREENREIRFLPVKTSWPYLIFYQPIPGGISVTSILDGRRDYRKVFDDN